MNRDEEAVQVFEVLADRKPHTLKQIADTQGMTTAQARNGYNHLRKYLGNEVIVVHKRAQHSTYRLANGAKEVVDYGEHLLRGMRTQVKNLMELVDVAKRNGMFADRRQGSVRQFAKMLEAGLGALSLTGAEDEESETVVEDSRSRRVGYPVS